MINNRTDARKTDVNLLTRVHHQCKTLLSTNFEGPEEKKKCVVNGRRSTELNTNVKLIKVNRLLWRHWKVGISRVNSSFMVEGAIFLLHKAIASKFARAAHLHSYKFKFM